MSELFDQDPRDPAPPRRSGRSRALIITAVILVVAFFALTTFASVYTDRLWFTDTGYGEVFSTLLWTRVALFAVFGTVMALAVAAAMYVAFRSRPLFHPNSPEQTGLDRYREAVTPIRTWLLVGISVILGIFAGTSAVGQWRHYLLWRHGGDFGQTDAQFDRDIGFFVFDLPWLHYLVDYGMAVLVVALLASAVVNYLYGGIRLQSPGDRLSGAAQVQLSVLVGLFVLLKGLDYWLDRFDLAYQSGNLIDGVTYTDANAVLPAKNILMGIALICAVLFFVNVWRRTWMLPSVGIALLAVSAILLGMIWPALVQQFQVKPSEADKEEAFIARNIEATRAAYDLEDVEVEGFDTDAATTDPSTDALDAQTSTVPLVDPKIVKSSFENFQQVSAYYSVADVLDVDRYSIDGNDRALVLGVRELDQSGIPSNDQNWSNLHTVYTHGNGVIAAYANQRPADNSAQEANDTESTSGVEDGGLEWAQGRNADENDLADALGEFEDRVYFGEQSPEYSIVGKASDDGSDVELNLVTPGATTQEDRTTYDGAGGISIGSSWNQLMYAIKFGEPNFLLSGRVNENSEVIYDRDPSERVEKVAPWLTVDSDPYPAVVDGRIQWIVDGYTTTDRYPGSERESFETMTDDALQTTSPGLQTLPTDEINYMRNAVKATVDAYDGTVTLYAWDEDDPMLQAWREAFPGTVQDRDTIPEALMEHLRYPEDLFKVQRYQLARYHVTDAGDFYQGSNRWEVPEDPYATSKLQAPYRLFVDSPSVAGTDQAYSLTSVYVPYNRSNLASFVSVDSDATDPEGYGTMRVLEIPGEQTLGPGQVANQFASDQEIADAIAQFNRSGATPVYGNVLTFPVADELMYVQPIYVTRQVGNASSPILQYVLVKYGTQIGFGTTLAAALQEMQGTTTDPGPGTGTEDPGQPDEPGTGDQSEDELIASANAAFEDAQAALEAGDLAKYQAAVNEMGRYLQQLDALRNGASSGADPSASASPTEGATEGE